MGKQAPARKTSSNKLVIMLLVGGIVILSIAGVILYQRQTPEPAPEPEKPAVEEKIEVPAPLVVSKPKPIKADAGPTVATEEPDTGADKPLKPKGGGGGSVKPGTIDGKAVNKYINQHFGQVRTCYERRLKINPLLEGKVDLNIGISTKGKATSISVNKDTVGDPQMLSCIKGVIRSWNLPKPEGGRVVIAKQFKFKKKT